MIIAESEEQLQRLINVVVTKSEEKGLYLKQCKVLHHGVFEGFTNPYMQHQCPRKDTGTSALVCILRKSSSPLMQDVRRRSEGGLGSRSLLLHP